MSAQTVQIQLNFAALWSQYFVKLQHLLDVIVLLQAGASAVSEEQIGTGRMFMRMEPARNERLEHAQTVGVAQDWLLKSFLRDAIELTGVFLDNCLAACSAIDLAAKGQVSTAEYQHTVAVLPLQRHKLHFPAKLAALERQICQALPLAPHVLSINRARTCVVHRLGTVSAQDVNESNELVVTWYTTRFSARELESGKVIEIDRPGILIEQESMLQMQLVEHERHFALGSQLQLTPHESYSTVVTLWRFGMSTVNVIETYAREKGLDVGSAQ